MPTASEFPADDSCTHTPQSAGFLDASAVGDAVDIPDDLYERIVKQVQEICTSIVPESAEPEFLSSPVVLAERPAPAAIPAPEPPESLAQAGLSLSETANLILKFLYLHGSLTGFSISRQVRLPFSVTERVLDYLKSERCTAVSSGDIAGSLSYRHQLTDTGRNRARDAFAECRYVGPAPVSLQDYARQCRRQAVSHVTLSAAALREALRDLLVDERMIERIGTMIASGQSVFFYGPPGNGKTLLSRAIGAVLNQLGGEIYVPYSISVDNQIVAVFDPSLHQPVAVAVADADSEESVGVTDQDAEIDGRWQKVRRPVVITGGELTLEMLELQFHSSSGFYTAPMQVKANGGVFVLDDFGRQRVSPQKLLNRWILPLEERTDFLTLATGKKFSVPFEQLIIFSANRIPPEMADPAFLRRLRQKIYMGPPTAEQLLELFRRGARERGMAFDSAAVQELLNSRYNPQNPPKFSDPRDLLDVIRAMCRFKGMAPRLDRALLNQAFDDCLCQPIDPGKPVEFNS